ncbi:MAG: RidA family protein [Chitinophagales bacterium]|nr:RidA family protein [Chitinophagales bacterium]
MKTIVTTPSAPAPIGPYSQATVAGNLIFVSGQVAKEAATGRLVTDDIKSETRQVMENLKAILQAAGAGFEHVVKTTIFLTDMNHFSQVNEVYGSYFTGHFPARETVAVKGLPLGVNVEISMIAVKAAD